MKSNLNDIKKIIIENKDEIFNMLYGSWIDQIPWYLSRVIDIDSKYVYESFFILLEIWARENKIIFFPPEEFYNKKIKKYATPIKERQDYKIWDISVNDIINYMRTKIPKELYATFNQDISDEYCFGDFCPRIGWIDENGNIQFDFE
ncbi:MAG: hypothetical protein GX282_04265 [Campylobacteraceae bacterium]|nr:hypothetical protein [Campylobacteraceae bacterium]